MPEILAAERSFCRSSVACTALHFAQPAMVTAHSVKILLLFA
jgi:hypothetical protein